MWTFLACKCNSQGSLPNQNNSYIHQRGIGTCNAGLCTCTDGYTGNDCNSCQTGFYVSSVDSGESTCTGNNAISFIAILIE